MAAPRDEIIAFCDELLEPEGFEDYGPNGIQVPGAREVELLSTGVTPSLELLEQAADMGAGLVLTHHQLLFGGLADGLSDQLTARLRVAIASGQTVASYHLPLDAHREIGNNVLLCEALGLELDSRTFAAVKGRDIGAIGVSSEPLSEAVLRSRITDATDREPLVFAHGPDEIRSVGIITGGASSSIAEAGALGLDAMVTGEAAEHVMSDAAELGIHFYAAGHYATERAGIIRLGELVADRFGIEHRFIDVTNPV